MYIYIFIFELSFKFIFKFLLKFIFLFIFTCIPGLTLHGYLSKISASVPLNRPKKLVVGSHFNVVRSKATGIRTKTSEKRSKIPQNDGKISDFRS